MKKLFVLLIILITACTGTPKSFIPAGTSSEKNMDIQADEAALIQMPLDVTIEYLDGLKTEFHNAGRVYIVPGEREITIRYENQMEITNLVSAVIYLQAEEYTVEMKKSLVDTVDFYLLTKDGDRIELGNSPIIKKSDNEFIPIPSP